MNIAEALDQSFSQRPAHPAIEDGERIASYADLAALTRRCAAGLRRLGVGRGDFVVLALPDSIEHVALICALARIGAVTASLDGASPAVDLRRAIAGFTPAAVVTPDGARLFAELPATALADVVAAGEDEMPREPYVDPDAPLMLVQSSGSTGVPKRLLLTHRHMAARNRRLIAAMSLNRDDRYFMAVPLSFLSGRRRCLSLLSLGGTVVFNRTTSVDGALATLRDRRISYTALTPTHLRLLLNGLPGDQPFCPDLRATVSAAPVTPVERLRARRRLTPHLFESYGTNELGDLVLGTPQDQDARPGDTGRVLPGVQAQVVDEAGALLPPGQSGRIRFAVPESPTAYLDAPEGTARHFADGWFYPGDHVVLDGEGSMRFLGREDDAINNSGVKFYPAEVEAVLASHPRVADAAVVATPHPVFGEVAVAFVVFRGRPPHPALGAYCAERLAAHKRPVAFLPLAKMPLVRPGKPDKPGLKAMLLEVLAREGANPPR